VRRPQAHAGIVDRLARAGRAAASAHARQIFRELSDLGGALEADPQALAQLNERHGLEMQPDSVPGLLERFGLRIGEHLTGGWTPRAL
jgi:hypothetical protein